MCFTEINQMREQLFKITFNLYQQNTTKERIHNYEEIIYFSPR